ncbi:helix-turn-helix domain-containing protein [Microbacterium betulae]|uniref:Helix-turn-helix domain-containing protein n=1 Tax=Microbacterium betulae TaxID=2981139 RepID=A0AA97FHH1_9MICO|nr:helix-turn-helix domain-containing protein [Microbacterium sp. AB]WOF23273.1 helix-turn-helix domain-containing protein [Microbacterium sp. AB]
MNGKSGRNETRVSALRRSAGWTQERLCEQSGVPVRTIQRLEAGNETSLETLSRIADALKVEVRDLFVTTDGAGFAAAIDGLDDRRARVRRHQWVLNIVGWAAISVGVLVGAGGAWSGPDRFFTYAIGGLVALTAGLWAVRGRPRWLPMAAVWVTAAVSLLYLLAFGWAWWVYGCVAVVVIALGALLTWLLVVETQRSV